MSNPAMLGTLNKTSRFSLSDPLETTLASKNAALLQSFSYIWNQPSLGLVTIPIGGPSAMMKLHNPGCFLREGFSEIELGYGGPAYILRRRGRDWWEQVPFRGWGYPGFPWLLDESTCSWTLF